MGKGICKKAGKLVGARNPKKSGKFVVGTVIVGIITTALGLFRYATSKDLVYRIEAVEKTVKEMTDPKSQKNSYRKVS